MAVKPSFYMYVPTYGRLTRSKYPDRSSHERNESFGSGKLFCYPPRRTVDNEADDLAEIDLLGLVTAVLRRWKLCAAICGVMIAAGLAYCFMVPTLYQTTSRVFVDTAQLKTTPKDEVQFVLSGKVLQKVFDDFKFGETTRFAGDTEALKHFRKLYDVREVPKTSLVEIAFKDSDVERSAAVNAATAQGYIEDVRNRVRRVLTTEQNVLQTVLAQREKERTEAVSALEAFKAKHGILALDMQRMQTEGELDRAAAAAAAAASPLLSQAGSSRLSYVAQPAKDPADREKVAQEQENLKKELARLDALTPEYQRINGRYAAAQAAYQRAFDAVQTQTATIELVNGDALARVAVPASTDDDFVKKQPAKAKVMAIVVLASLVLSVLVCVVLELLDRTVKTRREFERVSGLPVLAEVASDGKIDEAEKWQTAATQLALGANKTQKVFVTVQPSALKTEVSAAVRLATEFAKAGKGVLFVTFNTVADLEALLKKNGGRLEENTEAVLGALTTWGAAVGDVEFDATAASGARADDVLQGAAKVGYDVVVMETVALTDSAKALNLAAADGVQTVVIGELRQTKRDELADAMQMLERVKAHTVGSVVFEK